MPKIVANGGQFRATAQRVGGVGMPSLVSETMGLPSRNWRRQI
jgi:hypothetical protein